MTSIELKAARKRLGYSQTRFASWLGSEVATLRAVQYWESAQRAVPAYVVEIIRLNALLTNPKG